MTPFVAHLFGALRTLPSRALLRLAPAESAPDDQPFAPDDVERLLHVAPPDAADVLDDATWRDLMLARHADGFAPGTSIFGRQVLVRRLRAGADDREAAAQRSRIERLLAEPDALAALDRKLACLRHADIEVATLLFADTQPARPDWVGNLLWLPALLAASIACALLLSPWGWVGAGVAMYYLIAVRMRYQDVVGPWARKLRALQMLLRAVSLLDGSGLPLAEAFDGRGAGAGRLNRALARSPMAQAVPDAAEYGNWFLAADVRHYFDTLGSVFGARDVLRDCYWLCAGLEADVALARHLRARTAAGLAWCWATRAVDARTLALDDGVHPLLPDARGLSLALEDGKGAFLSGQNGVGKSTFLRTLGLNLASARAFGLCYARAATLPALPVVASMQNEDSLLDGHSLYIAELARARELLAAAGGARPVVCLVDEIFRGTNHEESVSAAAAVIDELAARALVIVSSHNLVLAPLLARRLAPWRIVRSDEGLRLEPGVLGRTNGVALLAEHGFDAAIQRKAEQVARWLAPNYFCGFCFCA